MCFENGLSTAVPELRGVGSYFTLTVAYLLGCFDDLHAIGTIQHLPLAREVFGEQTIDHAIQRVLDALMAWGYGPQRAHELQRTIAAVFWVV